MWTSTSSLYTYIIYLIKWVKAEFRNNKLVCVKWRPFSPWSTIQTTEESQEFTRLEICVMHLFFSCCSFPKMTVDFENEVWHFFQKYKMRNTCLRRQTFNVNSVGYFHAICRNSYHSQRREAVSKICNRKIL